MIKGELVKRVLGELGETEEHPIKAINLIVSENSEEYVLDLLRDSRKLYEAGLTTIDKSRKRTRGGCFFFLDKYRKQGLT